MTITVQSVVREVQRAVNESDGVRVPASDVVRLMNQSQRLIQNLRPDSTAAIAPFALIAGAKQSLPANAASLIDIQSNSTGNQRRITKCEISLLDAVEPNWRTRTPATTIEHFTHDVRTPRTFWVYPPAVPGTLVDMNASSYLDDLPEPGGDGMAWSTATGDIGVNDEFEGALIAMTLHMVYRSDLEGVLNVQLSEMYANQAGALLGVQLKSSSAVAPKE